LEQNPQFYREVKRGLYWNTRIILRWLILALLHSILIFGIVYFLNYEGTLDVLGRSTGYWVQCYLLSTPLLFTVTLKQVVITKFWFWIPVAAILLSLALNTALMFGLIILSSFTYLDYQTAAIVHVIPSYYILVFLVPAVCTLPDLFAD
jgi:phospholipid-transporting ATPase